MEWHITDAESLAIIDQEIGQTALTAAEYEIARRIVYATADFEYKSLVHFSERALQQGAAALAARSTIVVDVPMVQMGIVSNIQQTFANPVYCSTETITRPQKSKTLADWGIQTLARRYPEGIFVIGQSQTALIGLIELVEEEDIKPALIVGTPSGFVGVDVAKKRLEDSQVSYITINGRKGGAVVAVAIVNGLLDLAWEVYGQQSGAVSSFS
jgi:precorrin-8X/cobalt-precorrin-8 methylmutase